MLEAFYGYIFQLFQTIDYTSLFVMMLIEASMLPFPSEIPLLGIGIQAAHGAMNPFLGLLISLLAIFIGASINYAIGRFIGDVFFEKYGRYFFIKKHAYHEAKKLYKEDAVFYTFYGRLIPLVRQLMSIPAGIVHMPFGKFMALTLAGSALWHSILIALGYFLGDNTELIKEYTHLFTLILFGGGMAFLVYKHRNFLKKILENLKKS